MTSRATRKQVKATVRGTLIEESKTVLVWRCESDGRRDTWTRVGCGEQRGALHAEDVMELVMSEKGAAQS